MENKNSEASKTRDQLKKEMGMLDLLNNNIVIPYTVIEKCSVYPETLNVTESRQYRERGLLHITDSSHEFFLLLEQERVNHINLQMFSLLKVDMVDESIRDVLKNESLKNKFISLFEIKSDEEKVFNKIESVLASATYCSIIVINVHTCICILESYE